jgi:hypothetical protein
MGRRPVSVAVGLTWWELLRARKKLVASIMSAESIARSEWILTGRGLVSVPAVLRESRAASGSRLLGRVLEALSGHCETG